MPMRIKHHGSSELLEGVKGLSQACFIMPFADLTIYLVYRRRTEGEAFTKEYLRYADTELVVMLHFILMKVSDNKMECEAQEFKLKASHNE